MYKGSIKQNFTAVTSETIMAGSNSRGKGSYETRIDDLHLINLEDLYNPWNFYSVFLQEGFKILQCLQKWQLIIDNPKCFICENEVVRISL